MTTKRGTRSCPCRSVRGAAFTLIELLVVLLILAAVTTIAIRSTAKLQDRSRFERTERILIDLESAICGTVNEQFRDDVVASYLADTGELPKQLHDLWVRPANILKSHVATFDEDEGVVALGWNGPYLDRPVALADPGSSEVLDGYGAAISITVEPPDAVDLPSFTHWSFEATTPEGTTLKRVLVDEPSIHRTIAILPVQIVIENLAAGQSVESIAVRAYAPKKGDVKVIGATPQGTTSGQGTSYAFVFGKGLGLPPGKRAIRAYAQIGTNEYRSAVAQVRLVPGSNAVLALTIDLAKPPAPKPPPGGVPKNP